MNTENIYWAGGTGVEQFFKANEICSSTLKLKSYEGKKQSINDYSKHIMKIQLSLKGKGAKFYHTRH